MKNLIKILVAAFMLTLNAHAQDFHTSNSIETPMSLAIYKIFQETYRLRIYVERKEENEAKIFLYLKDAEGNLIYKRVFDKDENQKVVLLGLAELKDGIYTLEMSDKNGKTSKNFLKETNAILVRADRTLVALEDKFHFEAENHRNK